MDEETRKLIAEAAEDYCDGKISLTEFEHRVYDAKGHVGFVYDNIYMNAERRIQEAQHGIEEFSDRMFDQIVMPAIEAYIDDVTLGECMYLEERVTTYIGEGINMVGNTSNRDWEYRTDQRLKSEIEGLTCSARGSLHAKFKKLAQLISNEKED